MDTLAIIREKVERLAVLLPKSGIHAVLRHLELAESHFVRARHEGDGDLFADVIYRTNHAFEGILRESYTILAAQNSTNKSAFEIEAFLSQNSVLHERVMELFANYRKKWRNPSTHEHVATFNESEAFLALLSVTSFVGMLLDQMIDRLAFEQEERRLADAAEKLQQEMQKYRDEPLVDRVTHILETFVSGEDVDRAQSEMELAATLRAFLSAAVPSFTIAQEPLLQDQQGSMRPDFLVQDGDAKAVIELKRYRRWSPDIERPARDQVRRYMEAAGAVLGVLLALPAPDAYPTDGHDSVFAEPLDDDRYLVTIREVPKKPSR
jgi:hypothetical protein